MRKTKSCRWPQRWQHRSRPRAMLLRLRLLPWRSQRAPQNWPVIEPRCEGRWQGGRGMFSKCVYRCCLCVCFLFFLFIISFTVFNIFFKNVWQFLVFVTSFLDVFYIFTTSTKLCKPQFRVVFIAVVLFIFVSFWLVLICKNTMLHRSFYLYLNGLSLHSSNFHWNRKTFTQIGLGESSFGGPYFTHY